MELNKNTAVATLVALLAGIVFMREVRRRRSYTFPEKYPFSTTVQLFVNSHRMLHFLKECYDQFLFTTGQKTVHLNLFCMDDIVITNDVANITYVLKTNFEEYGKGPIFKNRFQALLGDGIFNTDGALWYKHRKTSAHLFNLNKFRTTVLATFNRHCDTLVGIIGKHADGGGAFDIAGLMFKFTLDSIGFIAFGQEIGALHQDRVLFAEAFDYCQEQINDSFFNPLWMLKRFFTPAGWWYFCCLWRVDSYALGVVREKRRLLLEEQAAKAAGGADAKTPSASGGGDMLSLYLDRANTDSAEGGSGELTDRFLRDVVLNFVIAGRDTTAQALSWAMLRLCMHQDIQKALREDVQLLIAEAKAKTPAEETTSFSYETLQAMRFLEAFCMEVLRLYPSVPKEAKYCAKDDTFPDGTQVKQGDIVCFSPWMMGRSQDLWPEAEQFRPSRFYTTTQQDASAPVRSGDLALTKPSPFLFTAFQAGPRTCLGQSLALMEMKCCLARLLCAFAFELAEPGGAESVIYCNSITLPIKGGLKVKARRL